jgi:hypothetical protein
VVVVALLLWLPVAQTVNSCPPDGLRAEVQSVSHGKM